jgi:hypothetical protein
MNEDAITAWLMKRRRTDAVMSFLVGFIAAGLGLLVGFLTFWFGYVLVYVGSRGVSAVAELALNQRLRLAHDWRLAGAALFVLLLFVGHARTSREELGDYPKRAYSVPPVLTFRAGLVGSLLLLLAHPGASSRMLADIFFSGPRLLAGAWGLLANAFRFGALDLRPCAAVLALLSTRGQAASFEELESLGLRAAVEQLRGVEGVVFLRKGVTLTSEFRHELLALSV